MPGWLELSGLGSGVGTPGGGDVNLGSTREFVFAVTDTANQAVDGLTLGNFQIILDRKPSGGDYAPAPETVSLLGLGGGRYAAQVTPGSDSDGYSYILEIIELDNFGLSAQDHHVDNWTVFTESTSNTENDAFCAVIDVLRDAQMVLAEGDEFGEPDVLSFMASRASEVEAVLAVGGHGGTVLSGGAPIDRTDRQGRILSDLCRRANSMLAASDALAAKARVNGSSIPDSVSDLRESGTAMLKTIADFLAGLVVKGGGLRTHLTTGGVARADSSPRQDYSRDKLIGLDTVF